MSLATSRQQHGLYADMALLGIALLWGATFVPVKQAVSDFPVLGFIGLRFLFGLLVLMPIGVWRLQQSRMTVRQIWQGMTTGLLFLMGYTFQTFGLRYTGAGRAAFITGISTILVPVILVLLFHEKLRSRPVWGALLATVGMAVLGYDGAVNGSLLGDCLVLAGAIAFAFHVIFMGRWGAGCDPVLFTMMQLVVVALLALVGAVLWESPIPALQPRTLQAALFTGIVVTGLGMLVQAWAQRTTSPTHTAVIFATEPLFGAVFGWLWVGESISHTGVAGCALILIGMLVAESG